VANDGSVYGAANDMGKRCERADAKAFTWLNRLQQPGRAV
jgi:hypothetical protein